MEEKVTVPKFASGLTKFSFLGGLYAILLFIPAITYLELMTGGGGFPVAWFTLILCIEFAKLSGFSISKQEAFIVYILAATEMFLPIGVIYSIYMRHSPITELFGLTELIPDWVAPGPNTGVFQLRTLLHPAWFVPLTITIVSTIVSAVLNIALGLLAREIFVEAERLPFPIQQMDARAIITLASREERPVRLLSVCAVFGFLYGFIVYAIPFIIQAWTGRPFQIIPIPWVDWNLQIERFFPGAMFGIATDIAPFASAFVLPFPVVLGIAIGSFAVYFFGNWLTVTQNLGIYPWWVPGMNMQIAYQRSTLYFWVSPLIGIGLATGLAPVLRHPKVFLRALQTSIRPLKTKERLTDPVPFLWFIGLPILASILVYIALFAILAPSFLSSYPWIVAIFVVLPFVGMLIGGRMRGETGIVSVPTGQLQSLLLYASGYQGVDAWFVPNPSGLTGGTLPWFKVAELTGTSVRSLLKAYFLLLPIAMLTGFAYIQMFWSIAPIPSARYPGAEIFWPVRLTYSLIWIRGQQTGLFQPLLVFEAFVIGTALYFAFDILRLPLSFTSLAVGAGTTPPFALTYLFGGVVAQIISRRTGKGWWDENKLLISAGLMMGESIAITISVAITIILNSIWSMPF